MVGVLDAVGVIVTVPVVVGVRDGVGVFVKPSFRMIGKYVIDCIEALAMITKPDATMMARIHFSNGEEVWFGGEPFIETYSVVSYRIELSHFSVYMDKLHSFHSILDFPTN
jgi:hypothetical protein